MLEGIDVSVAVVIPTYNSGRTLKRCLASVLEQVAQATDVVVVDDIGTTDDTRAIAVAYGVRLIISPAGMSESRNVGIKATTAELILNLDSDMWIQPGLVEALLNYFKRSSVDASTIAEISVGFGYWARGRAIDKRTVEVTGYGRSIRVFSRALYERIGGYDSDLEAGEDADFDQRARAAGAKIGHIEQPCIFHDEGALRLRGVLYKKFRYGTTLRAFERKHQRSFLTGYGRRVIAGLQISLREDPIALPAFLVLKAADAAAGALGRLSRKTVPARSPAEIPESFVPRRNERTTESEE